MRRTGGNNPKMSWSNLFSRGSQGGVPNHPQVKVAPGSHTSNVGGNVVYQDGQATVQMAQSAFNKFPSDNIPANALGIATQFDARWPGALVHSLRDHCEEIIIQNSDAVNALVLVHPSIWFPRMEILSNGANTDLVIYDIMFYIETMMNVTDDTRAKKYKGEIYNPFVYRDPVATTNTYSWENYDTSPTFSVPASGSVRVFAKYRNFLVDSKYFFSNVIGKEEPRIRHYTGNNIQANNGQTQASTPVLVSLTTHLRGLIYDDIVYAQMCLSWSAKTAVTRTICYERQTFSFFVNPNVETTDNLLTAMTGKYAWMFVILSQAAPTRNQIYSDWNAADVTNGAYWKELVDVTLLDSNQKPWQYVKIPAQYLKQNVMGDHWDSAIWQEKEILCLPFSTNCGVQRETGQDLGSKYMNGNWTLRFTPTTSTNNVVGSSMAIELIVLGARCSVFTQDGRTGMNHFNRL